MTSFPMEEYCNTCFFFFKSIESCPRSLIFQKGELYEMFLETLWVMSSFIPMLAFSMLVLHSLFKRTSRGLFMLVSLGLQQIIVALLKQYFAQARPRGACSTSFGYPSGHSGFAAGLTTWLLLEIVILHEKIPFKTSKVYLLMRNLSLMFTPLIPISRYFLNYHSPEQIMYGLLTGFLCTLLSFGILMSILVHQGHGKFYHLVMIKFWKKIRYYDNFVSSHHYSEKEVEDETKSPVQFGDHHHAKHPFRDSIRCFFEKYIIKTSLLIQEKIIDEIEVF